MPVKRQLITRAIVCARGFRFLRKAGRACAPCTCAGVSPGGVSPLTYRALNDSDAAVCRTRFNLVQMLSAVAIAASSGCNAAVYRPKVSFGSVRQGPRPLGRSCHQIFHWTRVIFSEVNHSLLYVISSAAAKTCGFSLLKRRGSE